MHTQITTFEDEVDTNGRTVGSSSGAEGTDTAGSRGADNWKAAMDVSSADVYDRRRVVSMRKALVKSVGDANERLRLRRRRSSND